MNNAIFWQDSQWATQGVGARNNNPGNLRCVGDKSPYPSECIASPGNGSFAKFPDLKTGIYADIEVYARKYSGKSADTITREWAGNPQSGSYWQAIRDCYR